MHLFTLLEGCFKDYFDHSMSDKHFLVPYNFVALLINSIMIRYLRKILTTTSVHHIYADAITKDDVNGLYSRP